MALKLLFVLFPFPLGYNLERTIDTHLFMRRLVLLAHLALFDGKCAAYQLITPGHKSPWHK
jgi:hypothetical protein